MWAEARAMNCVRSVTLGHPRLPSAYRRRPNGDVESRPPGADEPAEERDAGVALA